MSKPTSLVLLSGGMDSLATLLLAMQSTEVTDCLFINYGQRTARYEQFCAREQCSSLGLDYPTEFTLDLPHLLSSKLFLDPSGSDSFEVPGRNLVLLSLGAAYAQQLGCSQLWAGIRGSFNDSNEVFTDSLDETLCHSSGANLRLVCPVVDATRAELFKVAKEHGQLDLMIDKTWTGYYPHKERRYDWGWGPYNEKNFDSAIKERIAAWQQFLTSKDIS